MRTNDIATRRPALVEMHDSRIESVSILLGGKCTIAFSHIDVYFAENADSYQVWSYTGKVNLVGVSHVEVVGKIPDDGWVLDDAATLPKGDSLIWVTAVGQSQAIREWRVTFTNSASLRIACDAVELALGDALEMVEEWHGPL